MQRLTTLAQDDARIVFITGDLGFGVVEEFAEKLPDQFLNVGVAEQNMTGVAAGMALTGKVVFTYSIANFPTLRCIEQVRNDVCYHDANVKIVAVGGGLAYGSLGYTHHAVEDLAIMRTLPNMVVLAPGDPLEAAAATEALADAAGPAYLRLGKAGEPTCHGTDFTFEVGRAITVRDGSDVTLVATGAMLKTALDAAELLGRDHVDARVLSMHTVKPLDVRAIRRAAEETGRIVTIEEHITSGGLGGAVAEVLLDLDLDAGVRLRRLGIPEGHIRAVGSQEYLRRQLGLDERGVAASVCEFMTAPTASANGTFPRSRPEGASRLTSVRSGAGSV